eukprot:TRINITY_DN1251_c0_g4_i1.p1 TRINITY_DN1251_c0_g4~~TRINITY_DN1251_c0_g4_i1.p1  ORF type:complete len:320 (-),score=93.67 TRINITY_DN1251_c0_g4_i1:16-975(-)
MDKYRKVYKPKEDVPKSDEEIRVTAAGSVSAYVSRAATVFNELNKPRVVVQATGNALTKAVTAAEVIKRRFKGLHQITELKTVELQDEYEPLEEGLDKVIDTRSVPVIEIKLSKEPLDTSDKGYQPPLDESQVTEYDAEEMARGRGRGRGGGSKGRGRGKGKGRGKGDSKGKSEGKGKSKGKSKGKDEPKGKGKGKSKSKGKDEPKGKGKGKGKDSGKGKSKSKGYYEEDYYEAPRSKGKKGGKSSSKGKGYDDWEYPAPSKSKGKGKDKSKGKGKSSSYDDYYYQDRSYGGRSSSWDYDSKGKSKGKGSSKGKSKSSW